MMDSVVFNALLWGNVTLVALTGVVFALQFRRRFAAQHGYNVWRSVLAAPVLVIACSITSSFVQPSPAAPISPTVPSTAMAGSYAGGSTSATGERAPTDVQRQQVRTAVRVVIDIWALGVLLGLVRILGSLAAMRAVYRRAKPLSVDVRSRIGILAQTSVECFTSSEVRTPTVIGYFRPRIVLPQSIAIVLSVGALRQVLTHEMRHVYSRDNVSILAERLIALFLWFNPAAKWVAREIVFYRELRCDEPAMESSRSQYMRTLLTISQFALSTRCKVDLSSAAVSSQNVLRRRLAAIAQGREPIGVPCSAIACIGAFVLASALVATIAAPPLASARAIERDASLSYFFGRWICYDGDRGMSSGPIGIASFAPMKYGMLEKNQSLGGTWSFRGTAAWREERDGISIQGSSNIAPRFESRSSNAVATINVYKGLSISARRYRNIIVANSVSEFDSRAVIYSHSRWYTVQHAICERSQSNK